MTHVRRLLRDRAVLGGVAALVVFAVISASLIVWTARVASADDRQVRAATAQIQSTHELSEAALLLAGGDLDQRPTIAATLRTFERTHHGLHSGDPGLDLPGTGRRDLEIGFTAIEPAFTAVLETTRSLLDGPEASSLGAEVVAAAAEYRAQIAAIRSAFAADAAAHAVRAQQLQLTTVTIGFSLAIMVLMIAAHRRQRSGGGARPLPGPGELDQLTGLPRRSTLREHLIEAIHVRRPTVGFVALLLVDIRPSTEPRGLTPKRAHDRAVQEAARRIRETVRSTDLVARAGRSRFAVVIERSPRAEDAGKVAEKLIDVLAERVAAGPTIVDLAPAVGIALSPVDASTGDELLDKAELALRIASERPTPACRYFSSEQRSGVGSRVEMASALRDALGDEGGLWLAYQPKIRLADSAVIGLEALARWTHPEVGSVPPAEFIAIAEESDLILDLGRWVIDAACSQLAAWLHEGRPSLPVSVNVSTREFRHGELDSIVATALARHQIPAGLLEIEITEGVLIDDHEQPLQQMRDLRELGVRIAVDDFGTGYSSLSYLKRFPIDTLKIDRSFISELREGTEDAAIATAIIALAHSLGLHVIAEGVESKQQLEILLTLGCDIAQGFYFGRPAPASDVHRLWPVAVSARPVPDRREALR